MGKSRSSTVQWKKCGLKYWLSHCRGWLFEPLEPNWWTAWSTMRTPAMNPQNNLQGSLLSPSDWWPGVELSKYHPGHCRSVLGKTGQSDQIMQQTGDLELPEFQRDWVKVCISRQRGSSKNVRAKLSFLPLYLAIQCHVLSIVNWCLFNTMVLQRITITFSNHHQGMRLSVVFVRLISGLVFSGDHWNFP